MGKGPGGPNGPRGAKGPNVGAQKAIRRGPPGGKPGGPGVGNGPKFAKGSAGKKVPIGQRAGKSPAKKVPAKNSPAKKGTQKAGPGQGQRQNEKDDTAYNKLWCIDLVVQFGLKECVEDILDDL